MPGRFEFDDITSEIIGAAIYVHRILGPGLLEKTYEKCLAYKLQTQGFAVRRQIVADLKFEDLVIRDAYRIDLLVNNSVIVEIKSIECVTSLHFAQLLTYLKVMDRRVGLLMNFNTACLKTGIHRVVNSSR